MAHEWRCKDEVEQGVERVDGPLGYGGAEGAQHELGEDAAVEIAENGEAGQQRDAVGGEAEERRKLAINQSINQSTNQPTKYKRRHL